MSFESTGRGKPKEVVTVSPHPEGFCIYDGQGGPVGQAEQLGPHQHANKFYTCGHGGEMRASAGSLWQKRKGVTGGMETEKDNLHGQEKDNGDLS